VPLFVVGFLLFATIRSIGDAYLLGGGHVLGLMDGTVWSGLHGSVKQWAVNLLVVALAGVGLNTRLSLLKGLGTKPFLVGLGAATTVGFVSFCAITAVTIFGTP
jgi:uncharacterized membrane protein YadS